MFNSSAEIESLVRDFERCRLPAERWTHHAHLVVALWYLQRHHFDAALAILRRRIRRYNEALGNQNTDSSGYHETLTQLFLRAVAAHVARHPDAALADSASTLLASAPGDSAWPLIFYTRERLFSPAARRDWVEPDLAAAPAPP